MRAKTVAIVFTGMFLLSAPSVLAESGDEDPREFGYLGTQTVDLHCCLFHLPPDPPPPECDGTSGIAGSGIHGIGEGRFCGVQKGRPVQVHLVDLFTDAPRGSVYCTTDEGPYEVFGIMAPYPARSHRLIGETGTSPFIVPHDCMDTDDSGKTDLLVRIRPGTAVFGTARLDPVGAS